MNKGPYLLHDRSQNRFFREAAAGESHGHWQQGTDGATFYHRLAEAETTLRRITSRLTRHLTHVVTIGHAKKLAAKHPNPKRRPHDRC